MRVLIQRVLEASVYIGDSVYNEITNGYLLYVGFTHSDTKVTVDKAVQKIIKLRIYEDSNQKMNEDIPLSHDILSISQFTLYANTKGQHRPSFIEAMNHVLASELYDYFNEELALYRTVKKGIFGSYMRIKSTNDGPMTILLEL